MDKQLINYLNQYFNYIKKIFLEEYSEFLNYERIEEINSLENIFKINRESKFKIYITDKINVCLDINDFLEDNNLLTDAGLKDIDISAKIYIKFLKDNKDDLNRLVLSVILKPIISYLIGNENEVVSIGLTDLIVDNISTKYNIKYIKPYESKEKDIIENLFKIIDEKIIYEKVLNKRTKELRNYSFEEFMLSEILNSLNSKYSVYSKRIGKVYYSDSLYDYQNIDYNKELEIINKLSKDKEKNTNTKKDRIISIIECINNFKKNSILLDNIEIQKINMCYEKIEKLKNKEITDEDYKLALSIEEILMPIINKIWNLRLTSMSDFKEGSSFYILVGSKPNKKFVEAKLTSDIHIKNLCNKLKENYGFIYGVNNNIVYSTSNDVLVSETVETNENTIKFQNETIDIDNQKDSRLLPPELLIKHDLKNKHNGTVLLYKPIPIGIYVIYDNEFSIDYKKALELSENYELPIIKVNKNLYHLKSTTEHVKKEENVRKEKKEIIIKPKLKERLKSFKTNFLYETEEKEKVV